MSNLLILQQYRESLTRVGKSRHTVKAYLHDLTAFAQWFEQTTGRAFDPQVVDPRDITEYRGYLIQRSVKPATVNRRLIALRRFFQWAKQKGQLTSSPFEVLETVAVKPQKGTAPKWLSPKEQLALLRPVRLSGSKRDFAIIQTLLGAGLRISELANLQVSDIEVSERLGKLTVREGKGGKARQIPLDNKTRLALKDYQEERGEDVSGPLFVGQRGALSARGVDYLVQKYAYQAKLQEVTAHTLRHSFAKNLVDAGVSLDQVATLLGHESLDTTRIYTKPSEADLERAVRKAAGELDPTG